MKQSALRVTQRKETVQFMKNNLDYSSLFTHLFPGFFRDPGISGLPPEHVFAELALPLSGENGGLKQAPCPEEITFGFYCGDPALLRDAVRQVEPDWVQYFGETDRVFCGFDGTRPVSFCQLSDFGQYRDLRIGGPGCVGTLPEYRGRGIGLSMVGRATSLLKEEGFDLSWIHYTHLEHWYAKLGYRTVLHWNSRGIVC